MNDYEHHCGTHLCLLQRSFAYFYVLLYLSNKRKFEELFFLTITPELFLWPSFTLDSAPWASEKFPLLILQNAFCLLPLSVLTLVQSLLHSHRKCNATFKTQICRLKIPIVVSHSISLMYTRPSPGQVQVHNNTAFGHAVHEEPTEPPLCNPAWNSLFHLCCVMLQELQLLFCSGLGIPASQMSAGPLSHWNASTGCF